jgi:hypothetical protein
LLATPTPRPTPELTPTPTPEPTPEATPEPTPEPTPEATPIAEVSPTPEVPLDFATVAASPTLWPKQVALLKQTTFPLVLGGRVVGQAQVAAGTVLQLVRVLPDPSKEQVEVLYQNNKEIVPATAIDLIPRASALKSTANSPTPALPALAQKFSSPSAPAPTSVAKPGAADPLRTRAEFDSRITVSAMRGKSTKIEGGDFDDKRDRITITVKFHNSDPNRSFPGLRVEFYVFGQSLLNPKALKLLQRESKSLDLSPLQDTDFVTPEVVSAWDNTGAIFGAKYKGWYLVAHNSDGEAVLEKSSALFLDSPSGLSDLEVGRYYNKKLERMSVE